MGSSIPSPFQDGWHLGPFPVRAYAMTILLGVVVAVVLTPAWAVPFGLVGGRLHHVLTEPELYFGPGPSQSGPCTCGRADCGAVALGAVGAWIGCRRHERRSRQTREVLRLARRMRSVHLQHRAALVT